MSLNQEQGIYEEYPRSQFPGKVDNWANKQDVPVTMQPIVAQYQEPGTIWTSRQLKL